MANPMTAERMRMMAEYLAAHAKELRAHADEVERMERERNRMLEELGELYKLATNLIWTEDPTILIGVGLYVPELEKYIKRRVVERDDLKRRLAGALQCACNVVSSTDTKLWSDHFPSKSCPCDGCKIERGIKALGVPEPAVPTKENPND